MLCWGILDLSQSVCNCSSTVPAARWSCHCQRQCGIQAMRRRAPKFTADGAGLKDLCRWLHTLLWTMAAHWSKNIEFWLFQAPLSFLWCTAIRRNICIMLRTCIQFWLRHAVLLAHQHATVGHQPNFGDCEWRPHKQKNLTYLMGKALNLEWVSRSLRIVVHCDLN